MSKGFEGHDLDRFEGMISAAEAELLHRLAAHLSAGGIVEIGSWRGKSAIALALGAKANPRRPSVHCVEPHARFTGVYGGEFGPHDRAAFYRAMLDAGCSEDVALVNLSSAAAARAWDHKAGLLFIDGDHSEAAVEADVVAWAPHLVDGGYVAFDDALDPAAGPSRVIERLLASGRYRRVASAGKIVVLRKGGDGLGLLAGTSRADAVADVRTRAQAAAYDGDFAAARLGYGSFVSTERRYMYMETPKAACTSWKRAVATLEGAVIQVDAPPYHRETRLDMLIHQRRYVGVPTLLDVASDIRAAILSGSNDWHIFAMCRNPYSRLVSVFENKVRLGEPGYRHLTMRFGDEAGHSDARAAFSAFVHEIVADRAQLKRDAHLRLQTELLLVELIPYRRVYHIEQMQLALDALRAHLDARGQGAPITLNRMNQSAARPWRSYYDESAALIVAEAYATDFQVFDYDPADWRGPAASFAESEHEGRLRAEVVSRNQTIDSLYDLLDRQSGAVRG